MAEEAKKEEVLEEGEIVEIETQEDSNAEENVEEVVEQPTDEENVEGEEELENYSDRVQKRISNLTRRLREAERASESAYTYASQLQEQNKQLQQRSFTVDKSYLSEAEQRLKSQRAQATAALKTAHENSAFDKVAQAQDILAKIAVEESRVKQSRSQAEYQIQQSQTQQEQPVVQNYQAPAPDPKAEDWTDRNEWFGSDETMTLAAMNIHKKLVEEEGFDPSTDEYYTEIDKRIAVEFPHKFEKTENKKPQQRVASAGRADTSTSSNKKQVKLSPSEVQMARKLNVPLSEYAKFVKR